MKLSALNPCSSYRVYQDIIAGANMDKLRYREETYQLRGLMFDVRNKLKAGWPESVYHEALFETIDAQNIPVVSKQRRTFFHKGVAVHTFEPDLIVWDKIILELKALSYHAEFAGAHYAQLIHYLKFHGKDLGLLVNFGPSPVDIKRVLWNEQSIESVEDYSRIKYDVNREDRRILGTVRQCLLQIANQYGFGYPETIYRSLLALDIKDAGLTCVERAIVPAKWNGRILERYETRQLLVANNYLVHVRSMLEQPTKEDFLRTKTYLSSLNLKFGLVVNFARGQLQIYATQAD